MNEQVFEILTHLRKINANLYLESGNLRIDVKKGSLSDEVKSGIQLHRDKIIEFLKNNDKTSHSSIPLVEEQEGYPISDAQRRLWVLSQFDGGNEAYNMPRSLMLDGNYDIEKFKKSILAVISRHEILRTVFKKNKEGEILQFIVDVEDFNFHVDYKDYTKEARPIESARTYIQKDSYLPFDLENGPLIRVFLLQISSSEYVLYYNLHHIITDGWSMNILSRDILSYYNYYAKGEKITLPELRIQYKEYASWQLEQIQSDPYHIHRNYWLEKLSGELPVLNLPNSKKRPLIKSSNGRALKAYIGQESIDKISTYIQIQGGTLFTFLLASLKVLFHKYTGQSDILVGSPVAGRDHSDLEDQIGFYVNTLVLRSEVLSHDSFDQNYKRIKENILSSYNHQMYPFDRLVEELNVSRDISRSAIFDILVVLQNTGNKNDSKKALDVEISTIKDEGEVKSKFDLEFSIEDQENYLEILLTYNTDIYDKDVLESFLRYYQQILDLLIINSNKPINQINYLKPGEQEELLLSLNNTEVVIPEDKTILDLFEEQVAKKPNEIAVLYDGKKVTYQQLNVQVNRFACHLNSIIGDSLYLGVILPRSIESILSMLAILKLGKCYVPIDPNYPEERIDYILEDTKMSYVLSIQGLLETKGLEKITVLDVPTLVNSSSTEMDPLGTNVLNQDSAFIIYTSGSTGKPKGVLQTYTMLNNLIHWGLNYSGILPGLRHLQYSSFSFDSSIHDVYFTLCGGGSLFLLTEEERFNYTALEKVIIDYQIEVLSFPYAAWNNFINEIRSNFEGHKIKYIISTGEQLYVSEKVKAFLISNPEIELHNQYGPSETHVVTSHVISSDRSNIVHRSPIGKPINNTQIYILDANCQLVSKGVIGELYIGGHGVARGYLNKIELTDTSFLDNPFRPGERMYRTGDLGRWLSDGTLEFLGRNDHQVKIRGYRIELDEINTQLELYPTINQSLVLAFGEGNDTYLVGYYVSIEELSSKELIFHLSKSLPEYMIPQVYQHMESFPLTSNGKLDRKLLPDPEKKERTYVSPSNEIERQLVLIWAEILKTEGQKISVDDRFFELGGNSLKAISLMNAIYEVMSVKITLKEIFIKQTITEIANYILTVKQIKDKEESNKEEVKLIL